MVYLSLQKKPGSPLIHQIYHQLRQQILSGELPAGQKLPSSREMALHFNISRNTVNVAYDMLIAEGYLHGLPGKGIYVAQGALYTEKPPEIVHDYQFTAFTRQEIANDGIYFHSGTPALALFPRSQWNRIAYRTFREAPESVFGYDQPQGRPELRNTLATYLKKSRGIRCHPDQIVITSGAKQSLSLVAKCLLSPGREILLEDPTNINVQKIFAYHTGNIFPIPVDYEGICTDKLPQNSRPMFIFVTPSHQFPLGGALSIQRRLDLIHYAEKTGCYIVEDDYDSEFRYRGLPQSSIQELAPQKVIYIGTFSKTLFPSLRLGYLILPVPLVESFTEWKRLGDHHTNSLNQLTLKRFIEDGSLERHVARMKKIYRYRRDILMKCLNESFGSQIKLWGETAGMHLVAEFPEFKFSVQTMAKLAHRGVIISAVSEHAINPSTHCNQLILGYAHLNPEQIMEGVRRLKTVLAEKPFAGC